MSEESPETENTEVKDPEVQGDSPEVVQSDDSGASEDTGETEEQTEKFPSLANKFRNKHRGPLAFDLPSYGTAVSIPAKHTIWLWPEDVAEGNVARCIEQKLLVPWDDGEVAPDERTRVAVLPKTPVQRARAYREEQDEEDRKKQPFYEVVSEGDDLEREQPRTALSAFGGSSGKDASEGGPQVHSAAEVKSAGGGSKRARARGSSFKKNS